MIHLSMVQDGVYGIHKRKLGHDLQTLKSGS
jgi:hypothetical protein